MTTKTTGKPPQAEPNVGPSQQELQAAYRVHTLAHMLYGQLATIHPWVQHHPPMGAVDPAMMGYGAMPGFQSWPGTYNPVGRMGPPSYPWMGPSCFSGSEFIPR